MCRWVNVILYLLAVFAAGTACGPRPLSTQPTDIPFLPGRYVQESYVSPNFKPAEITYFLDAFILASPSQVSATAFLKIFQEELVRAWQAQGLKIGSGKDACRLSGTIHHLSVRGSSLRWLTGRLHATLGISGSITRGSQVLFAFRDQVQVSSPLAPGFAAPKEKDLLLRRLSQETVHHLLNELLLHGLTPESG